jgi:perosamine synthetase
LIPVFQPKIYFRDYVSVLKHLFKGNISGTSPVISEFENKFASKFNRKYAVAVSNGSVALDLSLQALNLDEGDEVILPSLTIVSVLSAVLRTKATPVFVDVEIDTWNASYEKIKEKITNKTKAIIVVHTYGLSADIKNLGEYCKEKKILIIEDTAEAHGQKYNKQYCGAIGDISTFSFYANKHVTSGEGGMLLTDNEDYYKILMKMRNLDFNNKKRFLHENMYWNYRLSGLQAALGISQLRNIDKTIRKKIKQGERYLQLLDNYKDIIQLPLKETSYCKNHFWVFGVVLKGCSKNTTEKVVMELSEFNIQTRPFFWPLHKQKFLDKKFIPDYQLENTDNLSSSGIYLPMGNHINDRTQKIIVNKLVHILKNVD